MHGEGLFGGLGASPSGGVAFTAYVTIALVESQLEPAAVARAVSFIQANMESLDGNVYAQALVAYALTRAGRPQMSSQHYCIAEPCHPIH